MINILFYVDHIGLYSFNLFVEDKSNKVINKVDDCFLLAYLKKKLNSMCMLH